jgi:outer membrane biosynthesis protein TonB
MKDTSEGSMNNDELGGESSSEEEEEANVDDCLKELFKLSRKMDAKHHKKVHRILSKAIDGLREIAKEDEEKKKKKKEKKKKEKEQEKKPIEEQVVESDEAEEPEEEPADTIISAAAELIQDVKAEIQGDPESLMERIKKKHEAKTMKMNRSMNLSSSQVNSDEEGSDLARLNALRKKREERRKKKGGGAKIKRCNTIE